MACLATYSDIRSTIQYARAMHIIDIDFVTESNKDTSFTLETVNMTFIMHAKYAQCIYEIDPFSVVKYASLSRTIEKYDMNASTCIRKLRYAFRYGNFTI